jgi:hypothetical protein
MLLRLRLLLLCLLLVFLEPWRRRMMLPPLPAKGRTRRGALKRAPQRATCDNASSRQNHFLPTCPNLNHQPT